MFSADIRMEGPVEPIDAPTPVVFGFSGGMPLFFVVKASPDIPPPSPMRAAPSNLYIAAAGLGVALVVTLWILRKRRQ